MLSALKKSLKSIQNCLRYEDFKKKSIFSNTNFFLKKSLKMGSHHQNHEICIVTIPSNIQALNFMQKNYIQKNDLKKQ